VEFREYSGGGLFIERGDDALALSGRELFHHLGEVGGVKVLKFFVSDTQLDAAERVGRDEVDEFPADGALGKPSLESANHAGRRETLERAADGARKAHIDLSDAEFDVVVGAELGEVDVVDADDFAAGGVDD